MEREDYIVVALVGQKWFIGNCDCEPDDRYMRLTNVREVLSAVNVAPSPSGMQINRMTMLVNSAYTNVPIPEMHVFADAWFVANDIEIDTLTALINQAAENETRSRAKAAGLAIPQGVSVRKGDQA